LLKLEKKKERLIKKTLGGLLTVVLDEIGPAVDVVDDDIHNVRIGLIAKSCRLRHGL